jgi:hypothetical protein
MADRVAAAVQLAIEATAQAVQAEEENTSLREELKGNLKVISSFEAALPRAHFLQLQLREKRAELEQKQKDLIELHSQLIATLKNPPAQSATQSVDSLEAIPVVMNAVQGHIMALTESAIDRNVVSIPVLAVAQVSHTFNKLFDSLVSQNIIEEGENERKERIGQFIGAQREILAKLGDVARGAQQAAPKEPKVVEEASDVTEQSQDESP